MDLRKIGLYGGTFDPVHLGHLIAARGVLEQLRLDELLFIPSARPPHKNGRDITDFGHRAEMVRLAVTGERGLGMDEREARRGGPSYTLDTVMEFKAGAGTREIHWIIGADSLAELGTWHRVADLIDACRIITVSRPGWEAPELTLLEATLGRDRVDKLRGGILETPRVDVSSTQIRARVARGLSIRYFVPDTVLAYVQTHALYRTAVG